MIIEDVASLPLVPQSEYVKSTSGIAFLVEDLAVDQPYRLELGDMRFVVVRRADDILDYYYEGQ